MADDWTAWGPLAERYRTPGPRKILTLDGGGIRGVITLGVLAELETQLRKRTGDPDYRLCQFFDLIGGTSTGAIIATGLASGMSVAEIADFYERFGSVAFERRRIWQKWQALYGDGGLIRTLKETFGDADLRPQNLKCLLVVVTRNATTDSAWPISSNPAAKYNDLSRPDCNLRIPLWKLVRASTAAPVFFPPETIPWDPADPAKAFVFVDGGTTAYNNCAFLMYRMATEPAYRLGWQTGEKRLLVVSVGTGSAPVPGVGTDDPSTNVVEAALNTLSALMSQAAVDQDVNCRVVGRCRYGGIIDRELHDLIPTDPQVPDSLLPLDIDTGKAFLYVRYNAELTEAGLADLRLKALDPRRLRKMDDVDNVPDLKKVGDALAERVTLAHLGSFAP
ncbi:patatin-like phospholipase family protein [Virgisporangium aurantiacum]|uniref:PNPLA domain-containing protein n=1 Tax=Virgisporangium aurantiacum TaxID=175570 RepID=A0A8J3ZA41_9ACTN|nr:patatin-like phospholipase family protein [Virgisporangium aurantiacum]GIJ57755.1 hypothetical protein Vau01_052710 [Virgisporangium aurantiacum]